MDKNRVKTISKTELDRIGNKVRLRCLWDIADKVVFLGDSSQFNDGFDLGVDYREALATLPQYGWLKIDKDLGTWTIFAPINTKHRDEFEKAMKKIKTRLKFVFKDTTTTVVAPGRMKIAYLNAQQTISTADDTGVDPQH